MGFKELLLLLLGVFHFSVGEVSSKATDNPTKGYLLKVSVHNLTSNYLQRIYPDVNYLKISKSKIARLDPHAFDHLTHLNLLEISDSSIDHPIDPGTFYRLPGLEILVLKNSNLHHINLNLTNVQELVLSGNQIDKFDSRLISGRNVNYLDLSDNQLSTLDSSFEGLRKLSMIDISKNKISTLGNVFDRNVNLQTILASDNKLRTTFGLRLPWLKSLDLFSNKLTSLDVESFSKMSSLQELMLAFNEIQTLNNPFSDLMELKTLNLAWNRIEKLHPNLFNHNPYLTKLSLQGNRLQYLEAFEISLLHLTHLDLSHNEVGSFSPNFFQSTPNLQVLDLSFNHLTTLQGQLQPLSSLKILNLAFNHLTLTKGDLEANTELLRLNLSSNSFSGSLEDFQHNQLLTDLDLSDNVMSQLCQVPIRMKGLLRLNLNGNEIEGLECLKDLDALCEVDVRNNPLICGNELDDLMTIFVARKLSPYRLTPEFQADLLVNQCENLSLNRSLNLWNSVKRKLCPQGHDLKARPIEELEEDPDTDTDSEDSSAESFETKETTQVPKAQQKPFIVIPLGIIRNDEMNKPNPLQNPQSERSSWEKIEENAELLKGFEDEELGKKPRFSWYTIALILIGLSLTLTCFNLLVFLYIRLKVFKRTGPSSSQKYKFLHNEVYKNTTEPSQINQPVEGDWGFENQTKNKIFTFGKINEILLNFRLNRKDQDTESAKNILINSSNVQTI